MKVILRSAITLVGFVVVATGVYFGFFFESRAQQNESSTGLRSKGLVPVLSAEAETVPERRLHREAKSRKYSADHGEDLRTQTAGEIFGRVSESRPSKPLPTSESDLVAVGKVTKSQPYLSQSNNRIYSEISFQIEEILKGSSDFASESRSITIDKEGGAIKMPNGQVLQYFVAGMGSLPVVDSRYLLFLKRSIDFDEYSILTGYELNLGGVIPLDEYQDREEYRGRREKDFVFDVRRILGN